MGSATTALVMVAGIATAATDRFGTHKVGEDTGTGILLPSNQTLRPLGDRLLVNNGKLLSSTLSPDGTHMAALSSGRGIALTMFDLAAGKVIQQAGKSADADLHLNSNNVGQEGPTYSPDGHYLWVPQVNVLLRFPVNADGTVGAFTEVPLAKIDGKSAVPAGMAFSADGSKLYVALNGQNTVAVLNPATGEVLARYPVGNAPRQITLIGDKAYVSNEGGRPAQEGDSTLNSYGTNIVANPETGASTTGTVSVIDLSGTSAEPRITSIDVETHPTALYQHGNALFVTNTGSDSVSVIDTATDKVVQTFNTDPMPGTDVGYHPNAVVMPDDQHLLVSLGRANAVAVYRYDNAQTPVSYQGLLPTDYYPTGLVVAPKLDGKVIVTNERGIGSRGPDRTINTGPGTDPATSSNTHNVTGSLTTFAMPDESQYAHYTSVVFANNNWDLVADQESGSADTTARPIPLRLGDPSTIKHVFLIDKENRSYDQIFGDVPEGNGDPSLAQFGAEVTPNHHALASQFTLFDNAYDIGTNSAEGHSWLMQADVNEYLESQNGEYERSYGSNNDVLGHQRTGFLWNAAENAGKTVHVYGEYNASFEQPDPKPSWADWYCDAKSMQAGNDPQLVGRTSSPIPSLNEITEPTYPMFNTTVPDQYRTEIWLRKFREAEKTGDLANLNLIWLPDDHTAGVRKNQPYPKAMVADNDLALGRIVDEISHSRFWKDSAIFVIQDDTQNGVDHVDGHRVPLMVISPYAKRGGVDSHYYSSLNVTRTIEQILGMQPMNAKDRAATVMFSAFTTEPDYTPYTHLQNKVDLTYGLDSLPCETATATAPVIPDEVSGIYQKWVEWSDNQRFAGDNATPDYANTEQFNRLTWYTTHDWKTPYPGDSRILAPDEVPGRFLPPNDSEN